jgi:hypothetical protein
LPGALLQSVLDRYSAELAREEKLQVTTWRSGKIVAFLALWAKMGARGDFAPRSPLLERLQTWMQHERLLKDADRAMLKSLFFRSKEARPHMENAMLKLPVPSGAQPVNHKFMDWDTKKIAVHLCLIAAEMYNKVQPHEFIDQAWQREKRDELAPNLVAMASRFNALAFWISATVVYAPEATWPTATDVIEKWIKVRGAL